MEIAEKNLAKLNKLFAIMDEDTLTRAEFLKSFEVVIQLVLKTEKQLIEKIDKQLKDELKDGKEKLKELNELHAEVIKKVEEENTASLSNIKKWAIEQIGEFLIKRKVNEKISELDLKIKQVDDKIKEVKDGKDGKDADEEKIVKEVLSKIPEAPDYKQEIKDIKDELEILKKQKGKIISGGIIGRDLIKDIDLSDQLDGVTKTFNIQAVWNIISVHLSSFPYSLRKTTDFTYTTTTITFTNQIDAASSLAAGQTCVLTVVTG